MRNRPPIAVAVHGGFHHSLPGGLVTSAEFSYPVYEQLRAQNRVLQDPLVFHVTGMNAQVGEDAQRVTAHEVSGNYYQALGIRPQLGRGIEPWDDTAASRPVAGAGVAAGVGASPVLSRLVESMLYGVAAYDPATLCGAALLLLTVAIGASPVPALRAARIEPMAALRRE